MLVRDFLETSARRTPDKTALIFEAQRWTYAGLDAMANRLAHALIELGVTHGDRVVIFQGNEPETVVAIFAVLKADAVFVVVNPTTKADKLAYMLNDCGAVALVSQARLRHVWGPASEQAPSLRGLVLSGVVADASGDEPAAVPVWSYEAIQAGMPAEPTPRRAIDFDLATLIYTSGSTGQPKGVMSAHANMVAAATSITTYLENAPGDVIIDVLPLSFDYGLYQVLMAFQVGATLVLERGFAYPRAVLERMVSEGVTGFPGVPTLFALLLQMKDLERYDLSRLRYLTNTAAALPVDHIQRLRAAFPGATLYSMYGLTECKRVSYLPPAELDRRPDSVGIPIPNTEVWVADENGAPLPPGTVGELVVRGAHVMRGYWNNPEATARTFRPGKFPGEQVLYTGDLFRRDAEGYLYFVGRKDDIIKCRGEKVSPKEVENVLYALPAVAEAAVIGVPDEVLGEAIRAVIVPAEGAVLTEREIIAHCRRHLEDYMVPSQVEFRETLPKTSSGKIARNQLRPAR